MKIIIGESGYPKVNTHALINNSSIIHQWLTMICSLLQLTYTFLWFTCIEELNLKVSISNIPGTDGIYLELYHVNSLCEWRHGDWWSIFWGYTTTGVELVSQSPFRMMYMERSLSTNFLYTPILTAILRWGESEKMH